MLAPHASKQIGVRKWTVRRVHEPFHTLIYLLFTALLHAAIFSCETGLDIDFREALPKWPPQPPCYTRNRQ